MKERWADSKQPQAGVKFRETAQTPKHFYGHEALQFMEQDHIYYPEGLYKHFSHSTSGARVPGLDWVLS